MQVPSNNALLADACRRHRARCRVSQVAPSNMAALPDAATTAFWESKAAKLYPYRWWLGGTSVLAFIAMGGCGLLGERAYVIASVAVGLPLMVVAWGLRTCCLNRLL